MDFRFGLDRIFDFDDDDQDEGREKKRRLDILGDEGALDSLALFRLSRALLNVTVLATVEAIALTSKKNEKVEPEHVEVSWASMDSEPARHIIAAPASTALFRFERGMEFDLAAQASFEEILQQSYDDLYYAQADEKGNDGAPDTALGRALSSRFVGRAVTRMRALKDKIDDRLNDVVSSQGESQVSRLMKDHAYIEYGVHLDIRQTDVNTGAVTESRHTDTIREIRNFNTGGNASPGGSGGSEFTSRHVRQTSAGSPFVTVGPHDVVEVSTRVERTTGIRDLVLKGITAYEEATPAETAGGARYGELGARGGRIVDARVAKILRERFVSETSIVPTDHVRFAFCGAGVPDPLLEAFEERKIPAVRAVRGQLKLRLHGGDPTTFDSVLTRLV